VALFCRGPRLNRGDSRNMQLSAVMLARLFAFIEPVDLNPRGKSYYPHLVSALVERFGFLKYPKDPDDFDETKGITFQMGRLGDITVHQVQIFNTAILIDTASSTDDSEKVLQDTLIWATEHLGLSYQPGMIKRRTYVSQVSFYSEALLERINPAILRLAERVNARLPEFWGLPLTYHPISVILSYDPLTTKLTPAVFSIERRAEAPFSENKYFSTAPLPTEEHIAFLQDFESELLGESVNLPLPEPTAADIIRMRQESRKGSKEL
jgi:hypothetical protein